MAKVDHGLEFIFKALGSTSRLRLLELLFIREEMSVVEISELLKAHYKGVSRNLVMLKRAGFLDSKIRQKYIYYSIREQNVGQYNLVLLAFLKSIMTKSAEKKKSKTGEIVLAATLEPRLRKLLKILSD